MRPAVLLDRDGTLLTERGYLVDEQKMRFYSFVVPALRRLQQQGYALVVVTNQSAIARGWLTHEGLERIHRKFRSTLKGQGVRIAGIYACPHGPDDGCRCRKPSPYLARKAARDLKLDLSASYVIGDQLRDLEMGRRAGTRAILVLTGSGRSVRRKAMKENAVITTNLLTAVRRIEREARLPTRRS